MTLVQKGETRDEVRSRRARVWFVREAIGPRPACTAVAERGDRRACAGSSEKEPSLTSRRDRLLHRREGIQIFLDRSKPPPRHRDPQGF